MTGAGSHEPETLHPRPRAPGYFDGCPWRSAWLPTEKGLLERLEGPRDITGNVQLYLTARRCDSLRMAAPLVGFVTGVNIEPVDAMAMVVRRSHAQGRDAKCYGDAISGGWLLESSERLLTIVGVGRGYLAEPEWPQRSVRS